jgi:hypothetical protein
VVEEESEYAYLVTSLSHGERTARQLLEIIRGHWDAIENGSHHRRDVALGEDKSRIRGANGKTTAAHVMASLRNLVLGLFEHENPDRRKRSSVPSWQRKMTASVAIKKMKSPS